MTIHAFKDSGDGYYQFDDQNGSLELPAWTQSLIPCAVVPIVSTQAETVSNITSAIQQSLDVGAKAWGYDSIVSAASYASSTNAQYAVDAKALIGWRDAVWAWAIPQFATVVAGTDPQTFMVNMPIQPTQPVA
jgi:hypothetical protein